jgi:precorrin-3B methylase
MSTQRKSSDDEKEARRQKKAVTLEQSLEVTRIGAGERQVHAGRGLFLLALQEDNSEYR